MQSIIHFMFFGFLINVCLAKNGSVKLPLEFVRTKQFQENHYNNPGLYYTKIGVGTPLQTLKVAFETSQRGVVVVLENHCRVFDQSVNYTNYNKHPCFKGAYNYAPDNSKSCIKTGLLCDLADTRSGSFGEWMADDFVIGDPSDSQNSMPLKNNIHFVSGRYTTNSDYPVVGLAINSSAPQSNLFYSAWKEGQLEKPVYSIHHKKCDKDVCENSGSIVLGNEDIENCEPVKFNYPITYDNESDFYADPMFQANSIELTNQNNKKVEFNQATNIVLVSQDNLLIVPKADATKILDFLDIKNYNTSEEVMAPKISCDSNFEIKFNFMNEILAVQSKNLLVQKAPDSCYLNLIVTSNNDNQQNVWVIGNQLTMDYCALYDMEKRTVGFGKIKVL